MPAAGCGATASECSDSRALPTAINVVLPGLDPIAVLPVSVPDAIAGVPRIAFVLHALFVESRANARHRYVLNDVFLI